MEDLPEDATVHELIKTVAALSPDRARTLIQVLEEEVSVMEDVVDHDALERIKRVRREQQSELKDLAKAVKDTRTAALDLNEQLKQMLPGFDWDSYHSDPNYLQNIVYQQENMHREVECDKVEDMIEENEYHKKFLVREIKELRAKRSVLQRKLDEGCELDLQVELAKATRENQDLREQYNYLYALANMQVANDSGVTDDVAGGSPRSSPVVY